MPRPKKPARLWQRKDGAWLILDDGHQFGTGASGACGQRAAEEALAKHIATRAPKRTGPAQPSEVTVGEVLALHVNLRGGEVAAPETLAYSVKALARFWTGTCDTVKGSTCRAYAEFRAKPETREYTGKAGKKWKRALAASPATARRELGVLQAALNDAHAEGVLIYAPKVTLPPNAPARDRWLTRAEAAKLLRAAAPHLRRFIVLSLRSGRRASAILALRLALSLDAGWIDASTGVIHFQGARERLTNKRKGAIKAPPQLAGHLRRWASAGGTHAIMWRGKPVAEIDTAFDAACRRAGLVDVTAHDLKTTAVTWFFQNGGTLEDAADWFDTTPATLMKHYRAHSPHHQSRAQAVIEARAPSTKR